MVLASCQPPMFIYEVFNNTGRDVSIVDRAKRVLIPPGKARRTEAASRGQLTLVTGSDELWHYGYGVLPRWGERDLRDFDADGGGFWRRPLLRLQLQPDGSLYAVGRNERPPLEAFRKQPHGFPLSPGVSYDRCPDCQAWNNPAPPTRIFGNTYYVGTNGLSSILVTSAAGHVLIDGGLAQTAPQIAASIRELGFRIEDVKLILNSHVHFDHAGGIAELRRMSGAQVAASAWSAAVLRTGKPAADDSQYGILAPIDPVSDVRVVADGEVLRVGELAFTMHATPGHTRGGTSWSWRSCEGERCLSVVYADSLSAVAAADFLFSRPERYPQVLHDFERSFASLETLPCEILITPHPGASNLYMRLWKRDAAFPLVDAGACRKYAGDARAGLQWTLDAEAQAVHEAQGAQ